MTETIVKERIDHAAEVSAAELAPPFSEEALALKYADEHANDLRYVATWNKWLIWNGQRWKSDDTRETFSYSRATCRQAAAVASSDQKRIASARTRAAIVALAGEDRRLAATVDQWDADHWLLNTPAGVIDLRNGKIRDPAPSDYMTKVTAAAPDGGCPLWDKFLHRVTGGDKELAGFLQRVAGYALTGLTHEHALFFFHGLGANGKSVFLNTISGILGDYHRTAPIEVFTASLHDRHPTELAGLRGARLVTAIETEEGRAWAESRIKALTGGDPISARFMRQDFFEYVPQFKLMIAGNHRPGLRSVDEAMRRRIHLIPFSTRIPLAERDLELAEKLKEEWPGILNWMIKGCLQWQKSGLTPPESVAAATNDYLESEDTLKNWLEECCRIDGNEWTPTGALFASWQQWAEASGEYVGSIRRFSPKLVAHGFKPVRRDSRGFLGLTIYRPATNPGGARKPIWTPPL